MDGFKVSGWIVGIILTGVAIYAQVQPSAEDTNLSEVYEEATQNMTVATIQDALIANGTISSDFVLEQDAADELADILQNVKSEQILRIIDKPETIEEVLGKRTYERVLNCFQNQ